MASFFKNLFRKEEDSQPVPAAPLTNDSPAAGRPPIFQEAGAAPDGLPSPVRNGLPASASGPFSAVSGRHMTAREIAALLPPALLRFDGISPDQPVPLPVGALRDSLQAGRPVLKLSQIQEACPELFQRAPLPEEDAEITLPLARVKGILEFSAPMNPPSLPSGTVPPLPTSAPLPAGNPFATIRPPSALPAASPFAAASAPVAGPLGNPFAPAGAISASPFAPAAAAPVASSSKNTASSPFAVAAAPAGLPPVAGPAPFPVAASASPFSAMAAAPAAAASPFAAVKPATTPFPVPASPFSVAPAAERPAMPAASPFTPAAAAPSAFPMSPMAAPAPAFTPVSSPSPTPASAAVLPPAAPVPVLKPSPFAPVAAASPQAPPLPGSFPQAAPPASAAPGPLTWPPPARADSTPPLPIAPQPRTSAIPAARSAPVPAAAAVLPPMVRSAPVMVSSPALSATPPVRTAPVAVAPVPASTPVPPVAPPTGPMVDLSLRAVLRDADPAQLGFVPDNVPESVRVSLPVDLVARQLASGRVEIGLEDLSAGIAEKFRPAFARAKAGLRINIPMSEVFHNLPESSRPALEPVATGEEHRSITTSPFQTPFAIKAEEDTSRHLLDLSVTGFNPAILPARPSTHPVPAPVLPPAPLPPVQPSAGGPPAVRVELPVLRPVASSPALPAAEAGDLPPLMPRPGLLSRPPGSATAATEAPVSASLPIPPAAPKSPPRLKSVPSSPTALRAFPKPAAPPSYDNGTSAAQPPPSLPAAPATNGSSLSPLPIPQVHENPTPVLPSPADSPVLPAMDSADDLGESFSAAKLNAEPPPRAGSVPVTLPPLATATAPVAVLAPPAAAEMPAAPVSGSLPATVPSDWPSGSLPASVPVADLVPSPSAWPSLSPAPDPGPTSTSPLVGRAGPVAPVLPIATTAPTPGKPAPATSPLEDLTFGCITDLRQLTLRAVLGTEQVLTPQDIVDRCASLPGLKACVLLQPHATLTSQGMDETEAAAFRASAAKTRDSLATLAETMGLGSGGNFTLRTDHGIRSFFLDSNLCLAVWHAQPQFSGGTREKLILIAHELAKPA